MAKFSISPKFLKDSFLVIKNKGLKEIIFGNKVTLDKKGKELLKWIKKNPKEFKKIGRKGSFVRVDIIHKGRGEVFLIDNGNARKGVLLFDENVKIRSGPDLYVYLSTNKNVKKKGLGKIIDLGLLKGTVGGQFYYIDKKIKDLKKYKSVVIHCKQFDELFSYAELK